MDCCGEELCGVSVWLPASDLLVLAVKCHWKQSPDHCIFVRIRLLVQSRVRYSDAQGCVGAALALTVVWALVMAVAWKAATTISLP